MTPKTNIIYLWTHQATLNNPSKNLNMEIDKFEKYGKGGRRTILKFWFQLS